MRSTPCLKFASMLTLSVLALSGCKSLYVEAAVINATSMPITLVEFDYPSASFGTQKLAPGDTYHYRFKVLGSGPTKILWTDAAHHDHSLAGPSLREGQQGTITATITGPNAQWTTRLQP